MDVVLNINMCCVCLVCFQSWCRRRHSLQWKESRISLSRNTWVDTREAISITITFQPV